MKNKILVFLTILFFSTLWSGCSSDKKEENKTIKIEAILPLTGSAAEFGIGDQRGLLIAKKDFEKKFSLLGKKLKINLNDSKNNPQTALNIFNKITSSNQNIFFITMSSIAMALKPKLQKENTIAFCVAAAPELTKGTKNLIRLLPTTSFQIEQILKNIKNNKEFGKDVIVFYIEDDFGFSFNKQCKLNAKKYGINYINGFPFKGNARDYRNIVLKALYRKPSTIILGGYGSSLGILVRNIREAGFKGPIIGTPELAYPNVTAVIGKNTKNIYVIDFNIDYNKLNVKNFINEFQNKYSRKPSMDAFIAYDAIGLLYEAINNKVKKNLNSILDGLYMIDEYQGITGKIKVDSSGNVLYPLKLKKL